MIIYFIFIALLTGFLITANRVFNARLGQFANPIAATFINFFIGFILLCIILSFEKEWYSIEALKEVPFLAWLSAPISVLFLALAIWIFPRLGAVRSTILIIAGQMIAATMLDWISGDYKSLLIQFSGVSLIILGVIIGQVKHPRTHKVPECQKYVHVA